MERRQSSGDPTGVRTISSSTNSQLSGQLLETIPGGAAAATPNLSSPSPTTISNQQAAETNFVTSSSMSDSNNFPSSTTSIPPPTGTLSAPFVFNITGPDNNNGGWDGMAGGAHIGVIISIVIGIFLVIAFSVWFCCGGRAWWSKQHERPNESNNLPLYTIRGQNTQAGVHRPVARGPDAPPIYAEVAPPEHQTVAGGLRDANELQRIEDEYALVSDGKTPLSEIPFEDVVLERHGSESGSSGSPSREFAARHHGMGGDTTGHTNT